VVTRPNFSITREGRHKDIVIQTQAQGALPMPWSVQQINVSLLVKELTEEDKYILMEQIKESLQIARANSR
jgi:hypothetical protein